jgi:signal transduction histidine kinase
VKLAVQIVGLVNLVAFTGLAAVALRQWRLRRDAAGAWAAASFAAIGVVVLVGRALPDEPDSFLEQAVERLDIVVLLLFPYLLYRFTVAFDPPSRRLARIVDSATTLLVVWTVALPNLPDEGEPRPAWFTAYVIAFVLHWTLLSIVVAMRLWRAGRGEPGVSRRRMEMLSLAAAAITIALVIVAFLPDAGRGVDLAAQLIVLLSVVGFVLGLAPPYIVRVLWRRREQGQLQRAVGSLMALATNEAEVAERVMEPMALIVGARSVALRNEAGELVGSYGPEGPELEAGGDLLVLDVPGGGTLSVRTGRYAPFFGDEELRLLRTLGSLTGLALDRARLFGQERAARLALEHADALKSDFVALAAHELRSPVATAGGIAETLTRRRGELSEEQRLELEDAMDVQMGRLALLVDQLLDLSRLDAEAVAIEPERFHVRARVEELVAAAAGASAGGIEVAIDPELEADADPVAFDRIVSNLVTNALRYGQPPIVVDARQADRHFRLSVEDRGAGVPIEFVPDLFERFTRSGDARERSAGTGLGLAIARSYAHAHRGDLLYEAAEPSGARFQLVLPAL